MAPRKRKAVEWGGDEAAKPVETTSVRVTRSSTRRPYSNSSAAESATELSKSELPKKSKKAKATGKKKEKEEEQVKAEEKMELVEEKVTEVVPPENNKADEETDGRDSRKRTIVVEHCKQCNSFKTRAIQVKDGLEKGVPGITVLLNPEKPRRGCFEIREEGGKKFISLLDMKRPFKPMKDLDMNEVISDIIGKLK